MSKINCNLIQSKSDNLKNKNLEKVTKRLSENGSIIDYSELKAEGITETPIKGFRYRLLYLIKESEIEQFTNYINNKYNNIKLTDSEKHSKSSINFKKKYKSHLEIELCVEGQHFIPDNLLRSDILFFFKDQEDALFVIVKDKYIEYILKSEHCIIGMIDFNNGKNLFFQEDNAIKSRMKTFQLEINKLSIKYKDIFFITISDSIIIKDSFQIVSQKGKFLPNNFDFRKIIEIFKEIRKITRQIFKMDVYGVFCYGTNKCKVIKSYSSNVFHVGILSYEFQKIFEMERICRKLKKNKQGDLYMTNSLYRSYHYYIKQNWQNDSTIQCSIDWCIQKEDIDIMKKEIDLVSEKDITVSKVPNKLLYF